MGGENTEKAFEQALVLFPEGTPHRWQKVADHMNGRQKVADQVNGREQCQLNLQVLWPPMVLPPTVRPRQPPMLKIRSPSYRPMFGTITPGRWVHRKKQIPRNRRRGVRMKRRKLEIVTGELNAEFERFFSMSRYRPSGATNTDDMEELSSKTSQINITTLV